MNTQEYYQLPKASALMKLFWKAAGGDAYLLERATYSDQIKYFCLGGVIIATGLMAGLAGGYAFYTIFSKKVVDVVSPENTSIILEAPLDTTTLLLSIFFGIIWGLVIYNIDRFIVTSTGKPDGSDTITWKKFKSALPRIIMGMIIAITISKPFEIRMFQTEINLAIQKEQEKEKQLLIEQANINFGKKSEGTKKEISEIQKRIDDKVTQSMKLREDVQREITGLNGNGAAYGPRAKQLERQAEIVEKEIAELRNTPEYKKSQEDLAKFETERIADVAAAEKKGAGLDGLLIRIQKAHEIAGWEITLFITLLFMTIELTPIFFKMMMHKTPYDYMAENRDDLILAEKGIQLKLDFISDKNKIEKYAVVNLEADKMIYEKARLSEVQKEITDYAIEKYKEQEKNKIDSDLDSYIKKVSDHEANQ